MKMIKMYFSLIAILMMSFQMNAHNKIQSASIDELFKATVEVCVQVTDGSNVCFKVTTDIANADGLKMSKLVGERNKESLSVWGFSQDSEGDNFQVIREQDVTVGKKNITIVAENYTIKDGKVNFRYRKAKK